MQKHINQQHLKQKGSKKNYIILLIIASLALFYLTNSGRKELTTKEEAVTVLKRKYPMYNDYPSNNLPIKNIEVTTTSDGWRIGMYVLGSGVPGIMQANCFLVTKFGDVSKTGFFNGEGPAKEINLETCTPKE